MRKFLTIAIFSLVAVLLVAPAVSLGEVDPYGNPIKEKEYKVLNEPAWDAGASAGGNAKCFDYYKFQSVQALFGAPKENFAPGEKITFTGDIANVNNYPVVDGYVFARVTRANPGSMGDGDFIVDEFFALEKTSLDAKERKRATFGWTVPQNAPSGKYRVDYFFSVGKKFNLGGLPFTNEVIAGSTGFNVVSSSGASVFFNRAETKVNGKKYAHIGNWPVLTKGEEVVISQPIKNTTSALKQIEVTYDLYFWDSLNSVDKISTKNESVSVAANSSKTLSYTIDQMNDSVYMLKMTAVSEGQKSIVNIRLVSEQERPRLNYPAITKFPLEKGDSFTLFSCYHNTSNLDTTGKVVVTLLDKNQNEVGKINYAGAISSMMSASKQDITAAEKYTYLKLVADVFNKEGNKVDSYETVYDCSILQSKECKRMEVVVPVAEKQPLITPKIIGYFVGLVILVIIIVVMLKRGKKVEGVAPLLLLAAISLATFGCGAKDAQAIYQERNPTVSGYYNQYWFNDCSSTACDVRNVSNTSISVKHSIGLIAGSLNSVPNDSLTFAFGKPVIFFNSSDGSWDTPYGKWCSRWDAQCFGDIKTAGETFVYVGHNRGDPSGNPYWLTWTGVEPSYFTLSSSDTNVITCSGGTCTAVAPGTATITATIPETIITPWLYITFNASEGWLFNPRTGADYGHRMCGGDDLTCTGVDYAGGNASWTSLPEATAKWDVTVSAVCGNGIKESGEQCDLGSGNGACPSACSSTCATNSSCATPAVCGNGVVEGSEQCDLGSGNGACPSSCSSSCATNSGCPCTSNCGAGSSCSSSANCQSGLCCINGACSSNCSTGQCSPACASGKQCCSGNSCRTDCNCAAEPSNANQQCCVSDGIWREKCTGCTSDSQCATNPVEYCNEETGVCTTDPSYAGTGSFDIMAAGDISIYLTSNPGDHSGSTRVTVTPVDGFNKSITLSPVSTSPDDNLKNQMTNWLNAFAPNPLTSGAYSQGSLLTVKVPYDIIPAGTSKTYKMIIKGVAGTIEKLREITVKIYGQGWSQP